MHGRAPTPPSLLLGAGWNAYGQLGTGNTASSTSPVAVTGGNTFVAIAAGAYTSCGLKASGSAWCWGEGPCPAVRVLLCASSVLLCDLCVCHACISSS